MSAVCSKCGVSGVTYVDPNSTKHKPHYCIECNPLINRDKKEATGMKTDNNNGNVVCRECDKVIGHYKGEGIVIGMCIRCYEVL